MGPTRSPDRPATPSQAKARQSFCDEAERARLDYERTGLHVTQAEVEAWAKSLGTGKPKRMRPLTDAQRRELRARSAHHRTDPEEAGVTLSGIRRRLTAR